MRAHLSSMVALTAIVSAGLYWGFGNRAIARFDEARTGAVLPVRQEPIAIGRGRSDALRVAVSDQVPRGGQAAVVFVRDADIYTCNDLGRELRRLARWAALDSLPILVATDSSGAARLTTYLSREKVPAQVIVVADGSILREAAGVGTPSLVLISAAGAVQGFARRDERSAIDFVSWAETLQKPTPVQLP